VGQAAPPPLPTVTLAEIYAAQGHLERAISTLDEVLAKEPGHTEAEKLRERFQAQLRKTKPSSIPPPPVVAPTTPIQAAPAIGTNVELGDAVSVASSATESPMRAAEAALDGEDAPVEEQLFEVDEVVAVAVDPSTVYVYWEVRPKTFALAKNRHPDGGLVVRVLAVAADASGPSSETRDIRVDALYGELFVRGLPQSAQVRLSVGYASSGGYEPFALGLDLTTPRAMPAARPARAVRRWSEIRREFEDPTLPRSAAAQAGAAHPAPYTPIPADPSGALPAPAWIDAGSRLVQVSEPVPGGFVRTSFHRLPGSSEIFRKEAFFSKGPFRAVDSLAFRQSHNLHPV
jgi:hypothetical protein